MTIFFKLPDDFECEYNFLWSNFLSVITVECIIHFSASGFFRHSRTNFKFKQGFSGSRIQTIW